MNNKTKTDINNGRTKKIQSPFQDFKGQEAKKTKKKSNINIFSTLHPILKRSKKEPILPTFEKKSTNQLRRYDDVNTILHSAVHETPLSTLIWMDQLEPGEAAMKLVKV